MTHAVGAVPHATPDEGSASPHPEHPPRLPGAGQDTLAGTLPLAPNETHKDPLANGPPISRFPTIISITSGEHSRRQRSPSSRGSSIRAEEIGQSTYNIYNSPTSSTLTGFANQHIPCTLPSTSDKGACGLEAGRWARGTFVIGRSAPVKIDKGIEVYLRSGADGEVDFVI